MNWRPVNWRLNINRLRCPAFNELICAPMYRCKRIAPLLHHTPLHHYHMPLLIDLPVAIHPYIFLSSVNWVVSLYWCLNDSDWSKTKSFRELDPIQIINPKTRRRGKRECLGRLKWSGQSSSMSSLYVITTRMCKGDRIVIIEEKTLARIIKSDLTRVRPETWHRS